MREIKFRVWHYDIEKMDYNAGLATEKGNKVSAINGEVMQYTGLKDKNGKEIYEGDIVKPGDTDYWGIVRWKPCRYILHYNDVNQFQDIFETVTEKHFEVIGNIYENPDLCKEIK